MSKRLLNFEELSEHLGVPVWKIRTLHRERKIPCVRLGYRTIRFDPEAVIAALTVPPRTEATAPETAAAAK